MRCPECGGHHEEGSAHCPEGEGESGRPVEFIPLAEVADAAAFEALANRLEEEGVPWYIQSDPPLGLPSDSGGAVAMIYVAENRFRHARRALDAVRPVGAEQRF
jgi:hypothetical protein